MGPRIVRPPVDICRGTRPSQAPKSLPLENTSPLPIAAIVAVEMIGPMPGTVMRRLAPSSCSDNISISFDTVAMRPSRYRQSVQRSSIMWIIRGDSLSVMARTIGISVRSARRPWRTAMSRSSRKARIKLFDRFDRDKLHGGTQHSLGNRFGVAEVVLLSPRIGTDIAGRHQPRIVAKRLELPTQVMRPDARLHADETEWHVGEPIIDLTARQLLAQNDGALLVEPDEVECVLADVDADCRNGFKAGGLAWHGMLLVLAAPFQPCG